MWWALGSDILAPPVDQATHHNTCRHRFRIRPPRHAPKHMNELWVCVWGGCSVGRPTEVRKTSYRECARRHSAPGPRKNLGPGGLPRRLLNVGRPRDARTLLATPTRGHPCLGVRGACGTVGAPTCPVEPAPLVTTEVAVSPYPRALADDGLLNKCARERRPETAAAKGNPLRRRRKSGDIAEASRQHG